MRRREFIASLLLTVLAKAASAQQSVEKKIALVQATTPAWPPLEDGPDGVYWKIFFDELATLGYAKDRNLKIDRFSGEGHQERYPEIGKQVLEGRPDLIVTTSGYIAAAFRRTITAIPILSFMSEPVKWGLVQSLARPGGNLTGVISDAGIEIIGKRLQLLKQAAPGIATVGYLGMQVGWQGMWGDFVRQAGSQTGIRIVGLPVRTSIPDEYRRVFAEAAADRPDGLLIGDAAEFNAHRGLIIELAEKYRLPAIYPARPYIDAGGLMAYTADLAELSRHLAKQASDILGGADPAQIPVYQVSKFELLVNRKAARTIELALPARLLGEADEVIE